MTDRAELSSAALSPRGPSTRETASTERDRFAGEKRGKLSTREIPLPMFRRGIFGIPAAARSFARRSHGCGFHAVESGASVSGRVGAEACVTRDIDEQTDRNISIGERNQTWTCRARIEPRHLLAVSRPLHPDFNVRTLPDNDRVLAISTTKLILSRIGAFRTESVDKLSAIT